MARPLCCPDLFRRVAFSFDIFAKPSVTCVTCPWRNTHVAQITQATISRKRHALHGLFVRCSLVSQATNRAQYTNKTDPAFRRSRIVHALFTSNKNWPASLCWLPSRIDWQQAKVRRKPTSKLFCDCLGLSLFKTHKRPLWIDNCNPLGIYSLKERD